jgi:hypothetical protein
VPNEAGKALEPLIHACRPVGSPLHPLHHCVPAYGQLRSVDLLHFPLDTPLAYRSHWAIAVVFDLRLLGLCRSSIRSPSVIRVRIGGVFGIWEIDHSPEAVSVLIIVDGLGPLTKLIPCCLPFLCQIGVLPIGLDMIGLGVSDLLKD